MNFALIMFRSSRFQSFLSTRRRQTLLNKNVLLVDNIPRSLLPRNGVYHRYNTSESSILPDEAGRRAFEIRKERDYHKSEQVTSGGEKSCIETLLSHAGLPFSGSSKSHNEPLAPPLHLESTYTRPPSGDYFNEEDGGNGWIYSRVGNPTRKLLEDTVKELELTRSCLSNQDASESTTCAFSSGMAAASAIVLALPQPLHIILPDDIYHGVPFLLKGLFLQRGVTYSSIDMTNIDFIREELQSTKTGNVLVWMESPSNPGCKVTDIKDVCKLVSKYKDKLNVTTVVDSTWAPPTLTQPLLVRILFQISMHSP